MNQEKEASFFKKVYMSIFKIEKYPQLASKKIGAVLSYMIKLLAIFTIIVSFCLVYETKQELGQTIKYIEENIPDFTFENNILKLQEESEVVLENDDNILFSTIIIDTNSDISEETLNNYKNKIQNVSNGIVFLDNKLIINIATTNQIIEYPYEEITQNNQTEKIDKQYLLNYFTGNNLVLIYIGIFIITYIYVFMIYFISILLDVILLGMFAYVTALLMRLHLRFVAMCKIAIHSLTLPILLNSLAIILETFFDFKIQYFEIMYIGIACIYIVAAILMIKSDVIKSKEELAKIIEEQAKVKMELERKKEEEEIEKEKQRRDKEKEKKRKKEQEEKNKDKEIDDELQGENA